MAAALGLMVALGQGGSIAARPQAVISAEGSTRPADYLAGQLIVKFKAGIDVQRAREATGALPVMSVLPLAFGQVYRVRLDAHSDVLQAVETMRGRSDVEYAEPDYLYHAMLVPDDPYYSSSGSWGQPYDDLWGLKKIQAESAWDVSQGDGVVVAVVDSGLDLAHADIAANVWTNRGEIPGNGRDDDGNGAADDVHGYDFTTVRSRDGNGCGARKPRDGNPEDAYGHGTHVAGIIAATGQNGVGIIGVAPRAKVMPVKGLDDLGCGTASDIADAIRYAVDAGADVINLSIGGPLGSSLIEEALTYASRKGTVLVAAAGNGGWDVTQFLPAAHPMVIAVSATDRFDQKPRFSNFGSKIAVAAPGGDEFDALDTDRTFENILSLRAQTTGSPEMVVGNDYYRAEGTSMAAAYVSGIAALVLDAQPALPRRLVPFVLEGSADDVGAPGFDFYSGYGRVDAERAVLLADQAPRLAELTVSLEAVSRAVSPVGPQIDVPVVPPVGPMAVVIEVGNVGLAEARDVLVELYDGDPDQGGSILGSWTIPLLAKRGSVRLRSIVSPGAVGFHTLSAVVDRPRQIPELVEANDTATALVEVSTFHFSAEHTRYDMDGFSSENPSIDGDVIVFEDKASSLRPSIGMIAADGSNYDKVVLSDTVFDVNHDPDISGRSVVWEGRNYFSGNSQIFLAATGTSWTNVSPAYADQVRPKISRDRVVWEDYRNSANGFLDPDVYLFNVSTSQTRRLTTDVHGQYEPDVSGNRIVWIDTRDSTAGDVYFCEDDGISCPEQRLTSTGYKSEPAIDDTRIVWIDRRNGPYDVYLYDLGPDGSLGTGDCDASGRCEGEHRITDHPDVRVSGPAISGTRIVWSDYWGIRVHDLMTGHERSLTSGLDSPLFTACDISGDRVVMQSEEDGLGELFVATLKSFPTAPTGLTATPRRGQGKVVLDWDDSEEPGLRKYAIYLATAPGGPFRRLGTRAASSYNDTTLPRKATAVFYRVTAVDKDGDEGGFSNEVSVAWDQTSGLTSWTDDETARSRPTRRGLQKNR